MCIFSAPAAIQRKIISGKNDAREEAKIDGVFQLKPVLDE